LIGRAYLRYARAMTPGSFRKLQLAIIISLLLGVGLVVSLFTRARPVTYPDGLSIQLLGVSIGTNNFIHGSPVEKLMNKFHLIPPAGLSFAGFTLRQPRALFAMDEDADLAAWILVRGAAVPPVTYYWDGVHVVAANRSGRSFENPPPRPFSSSSNEVIMSVPFRAFPRDGASFLLRLQPPPVGNLPAWKKDAVREWAEFEIPNPKFKKSERWERAALPVTNRAGGMEFVLTGISTSPKAQVHFRSSTRDWSIQEARIVDEEGNSSSWNRISYPENEFVVEFDYGLEANRVWKIETKFIGLRDFPPRVEKEFPAADLSRVEVNSSGPEVPFKDVTGTVYHCRFNGRELSIRREAGFDRPYLLLVRATQDGKPINFEGGSAWSGRRFGPKSQQWWLPGTSQTGATNLSLQFYSPKVVEATYYAVASDLAEGTKPE
jgi:hypothetical protein